MDQDELKQKLDQSEEQANLTLAEFPKTLTKERQRMIIALVRYIRSEMQESGLFAHLRTAENDDVTATELRQN